MANAPFDLPEVDEVQITLIMDNSVDVLMAGNEVARRFPVRRDLFERAQPMAEHGFSTLIRARRGTTIGTVLFDTGVTRAGLLHNLDALEVDLKAVQAIVLSHGHADHAMGLPGVVERLGTRGLPLVLHPDAYLERRVVLPNGAEIGLPAPRLADFRREVIEVIESAAPSMLVDNMVLISGEVGRTTEFETGFPGHQALRQGQWEADPLIHDDQCAIIRVRGKGLVVISGCGHSGIINVLRHAQELTGVTQLYAVVGGFHLTGAAFAPRIPATIAALQQMQPRWLMPGHCTGWAATHQIARAMPEAFIANSAGTTLTLPA